MDKEFSMGYFGNRLEPYTVETIKFRDHIA